MGAPPIGLDSEFGRWDFGLGRSVYLDILMGLPQHAEGPTQFYRVLPETNGAPTGRPLVCGSKYQWAKRRVWCCRTAASQAPALVGLFRSRLNFCIAHRTKCWSMRCAREYNSER